ncbi:sulfate transporter CysZ [Idiomarina tyrosinivorans]|uniref:Sulfate transporter CysZ n=1 Tax=Idiomarina tyrosinivorans TaxID=1445662 RepID=A0A432ZLQ2_9GAMM|nr:sulfate transporter CysZ [Idiomarina tyrosinivorans]RUO78889.1 sulfate transporter CysZ [Idiomarina tyrosinivorans]
MQPYSQSGFAYIGQGFSLISQKGLKRFVIVPIIVNLLLFAAAFSWFFSMVGVYVDKLMNWLPSWMAWLEWLVWPFLVIAVLVLFSFVFTAITNIIAAPFNGLLSEKVERHLTGQGIGDDGLLGIIKDVPRTVGRELQKLMYYLPRAIGFFLLSLLLPVVGQIIWFLWVSWMMAIQYLDYPFDNHKLAFNTMRSALNQQRGRSFGFGIGIALLAIVPILNFFIMPVAICAATALWVDHLRERLITPYR